MVLTPGDQPVTQSSLSSPARFHHARRKQRTPLETKRSKARLAILVAFYLYINFGAITPNVLRWLMKNLIGRSDFDSSPVACVDTRNHRDFGDFWQENSPNGGERAGLGAAGHLGSRDGGGRSARRLASRRERKAEKRDGAVRFYVHPSLPELE